MTPAPAVWLLPALLLIAAGWDLWRLEIPNTLCALLAAGFVVAAMLAGLPWPVLLQQLGIGLLTLVICIGLFAFRLFGGGDGKLLAATVMWFAPIKLPLFLLTMALVGGALALLLAGFRRLPLPQRWQRAQWLARLHESGGAIPYAPAIASAGLISLPHFAWRVPMP